MRKVKVVKNMETKETRLGGEHTMHYTDDVLKNCTPETFVLLTNVTPIHLILKKNKKVF